jgi:hypothetical protein
LEEIGVLVKSLISEASIPADSAEISGDATGTTFSVLFSGSPSLGAQRVQRVLGLLRPVTRGGQWRQLSAKAIDTTSCAVYLSGDKNPQMIQCERHTKELLKCLQSQLVDVKFVANRRAAIISQDGVPVAKVTSVRRGVSEVEWNLERTGSLGIDRVAALAAWRKACDSTGFKNWSRG